jgi:predicted glycoside hydrolase/deacetylase ChbG (UPF0249 family)
VASVPDAQAKRIVVCADDFAVHEGASRGIAALAAAGRVTATSAMVLSPRWAQDVKLLEPLRGKVDVGLHLDLTSGFARAAGYGRSLSRWMLHSFVVPAQAGMTEVIESQLLAFEQSWGAPPDHLDGHQHVHQFAGIREALVAVLRKRYPQRRPWLRLSVPVRGGIKGRIIAAMGARELRRLAAQAGLSCTRQLAGVYDFSGDEARYASHMDLWLREADDGAVLMCHPAAAAPADDEIGPARERECRWLAGPGFAAALASQRATPVTGTSLFAGAA